MTVLVKVSLARFSWALATARSESTLVRRNTYPSAVVSGKIADAYWQRHSPKARRRLDLSHNDARDAFESQHCHVYLAVDEGNVAVGGFAVLEGELLGLWGPGIGDWLVGHAVRIGADRLDCFEGYLSDKLYKNHGFEIVSRQPNYTAGQPDVVWMRRK